MPVVSPKFAIFLVLLSVSVCSQLKSPEDVYSEINKEQGQGHTAQISTLRLVQVIFRHGDRTPLGPVFPNDLYGHENDWPTSWAQLTNRGKMDQFVLGKFLRWRYLGYLSHNYSPAEVYVQSSDFDRTIMSAQANLAALFPAPKLGRDEISWPSFVPIHSIPLKYDNKVTFVTDCERYNLELQKVLHSEEVLDINKKSKDFYNYLTTHTRRAVTDFTHVAEIYDTLFVQMSHGKVLPDWSDDIFPQKMLHYALMPFEFITKNENMKRLRTGPLLTEILSNFQLSIETSGKIEAKKYKMMIYSGHDTTLTKILDSLSLYDHLHIPPYAAAILMELHTIKNKNYIKIFYRNSTKEEKSSEPIDLRIPDCIDNSGLCELETFKNILEKKSLLISDSEWRSECKLGNSEYFYEPMKEKELKTLFDTLISFFAYFYKLFYHIFNRIFDFLFMDFLNAYF